MSTANRLAFLQTSEPNVGADALYKKIADELHAHKRVLWLLSGGSNIPLSVYIMDKLDTADLEYLAIGLCDERYGAYKHPDSNLYQLLQAGFRARGAITIPILVPGKVSLEETREQYARLIDFAMSRSHAVVAQLGIGEDGHIAGILPNSVAAKSKELTVGYEAKPFDRITLGFEALKQVDSAFVFAFGKNKRQVLSDLHDKSLPLSKQPAQVLKELKEVYVYNDQLGEKNMKICVAGLGKMGIQIAQKLAEDGHEVIANNRSPEPIAVAEGFGAKAAATKQLAVEAFGNDQVIVWLMVPSEVVTAELSSWLELIPKNSIMIDGGNSDFRNTKEHSKLVADHGSVLVDVGTSGGILGLENGFSMMVGGDDQAVKTISPALETLAKPSGAWKQFGPSGSGHFVKMVHNAIEYGVMESLAEGYRLLKEGPYTSLDLGAAGTVWQNGSIIESALNGLAADALKDNPNLDGVEGYVAESGEARWSLEVAKETNIKVPSIQAAFDVRIASQNGETTFATKLLAELRNKFGGHAINKQ